tara:strand:+ start:562 stop:852 length:291 start_codon:yes stop_codon:yes gene_type:complete
MKHILLSLIIFFTFLDAWLTEILLEDPSRFREANPLMAFFMKIPFGMYVLKLSVIALLFVYIKKARNIFLACILFGMMLVCFWNSFLLLYLENRLN